MTRYVDNYVKGYREGFRAAVRHGKWLKDTVSCEDGHEWRKCSVCLEIIKVEKEMRFDRPRYCEYCGAKMDEPMEVRE